MRFFFAAYCPTGNTALGYGYCPAGAIRLRCSSIAATPQYDSLLRLLPNGQYGADMHKKSTAIGLCSKLRLQSNHANKSYFDLISLGKQ